MIDGCKHGPRDLIRQPCTDCEREARQEEERLEPIRRRLRIRIMEATEVARMSGKFSESTFELGLDVILHEELPDVAVGQPKFLDELERLRVAMSNHRDATYRLGAIYALDEVRRLVSKPPGSGE